MMTPPKSLQCLIAAQPKAFTTQLLTDIRVEHNIEKLIEEKGVENPPIVEPTTFPLPEYNIQFIDCADECHANDIAANVSAIVSEFAQKWPIARLDGLTFALDYPQALQNLDRGYYASEPLEPTDNEHGIGLAMSPTVKRDGKYLRRIMMISSVSDTLMGDDEDARNIAIGVIWSQLSIVSLFEMMDVTLPDFLMKPLPASLDGSLYMYSGGLFESYFGVRNCAPFHKIFMEDYDSEVVDIIDLMDTQVPSEKLDYQTHKDVGRLFEAVVVVFVEMLRRSANYIGHHEGTGIDHILSKRLQEKLVDVELLDWFFLFQRDLNCLNKRVGKWENENEFFVLNTHLERLFWQYGMVIEWPDKTEMYMHVFPT